MAKADLLLPDGTKVTIDGSADEITKIIAAVGNQQSSTLAASEPAKPVRRSRGKKIARRSVAKASGTSFPAGPTSLIIELRDEGFFKGEKRSFSDIQKRLEEGGHIYARTTLSPVLVNLVRRKQLRRVKDGGRWAYTSSS